MNQSIGDVEIRENIGVVFGRHMLGKSVSLRDRNHLFESCAICITSGERTDELNFKTISGLEQAPRNLKNFNLPFVRGNRADVDDDRPDVALSILLRLKEPSAKCVWNSPGFFGARPRQSFGVGRIAKDAGGSSQGERFQQGRTPIKAADPRS